MILSTRCLKCRYEENLKIKEKLILNKKLKNNHIINNCKIDGKVKFYNTLTRNYLNY